MTDTTVLLIHLSTGEDMIGEVRRTPSGYELHRPALPQIQVDHAAQSMRIGIAPLHPWDQSATDETLYVDASHVVYTRTLPEQMINAYLQFRSGLVMGVPSGSASPSLASLLKG